MLVLYCGERVQDDCSICMKYRDVGVRRLCCLTGVVVRVPD